MAVLDRVAETGAVAPQLWRLKALNVLIVAERRRRIDAAKRQMLAGFLRDLPVTLDTETADRAWETTAALAEQLGLTMYDTCYLELALRRRLPLASLDKGLRSAAGKMGVELLG